MDTLTLKKDFVLAGFPDNQSEALVRALANVDDGTATKGDLNHLESKIDQKVELLEQKITVKMLTLGFTIIGVMIALKYIPSA